MNKHLFYYGLKDCGPEYAIESTWSIEEDSLDYVVEECAGNYNDDHDGWDASWPVKLELYDGNKKLLGVFEVEREFAPTFEATIIDSPNTKG